MRKLNAADSPLNVVDSRSDKMNFPHKQQPVLHLKEFIQFSNICTTLGIFALTADR